MKLQLNSTWVQLLLVSILFFIQLYIIFLVAPYFQPIWDIFKTVLIPVIIAMIFAYLLNPLVDKLTGWRIKRIFSILLIYLTFLGGLAAAIWFGGPIIVKQFRELMAELPRIQEMLQNWYIYLNNHIEQLPDGLHHGIDDAIINMESNVRIYMTDILEGAGGFLSSLFIIVVIPFLIFYFLNDVEIIRKSLYHLIPRKYRKRALRIWKDVDHSLGEYIRGQITVSLFVGLLAFIGYWLIGMPYALFLSIFIGITNIIPYFGAILGAIPAVLIAIITEPSLVLWVIAINTLIQMIEGNVLAPYIVGKRLHIHPVFIILALLVGEEIGGLVGLILAVPIFVVLRVFLHHSLVHIRTYQERKRKRAQAETSG